MSNIFPIEHLQLEAPATKADISRLEGLTKSLLASVRPPRQHLTAETKAIHVRTIESFYAEMCPCCGERQVVDGGQRSRLGEFDHWTENRARAGPHETWLICAECHSQFTRHTAERHDRRVEWDAYQKRRRRTVERLRPLLL